MIEALLGRDETSSSVAGLLEVRPGGAGVQDPGGFFRVHTFYTAEEQQAVLYRRALLAHRR